MREASVWSPIYHISPLSTMFFQKHQGPDAISERRVRRCRARYAQGAASSAAPLGTQRALTSPVFCASLTWTSTIMLFRATLDPFWDCQEAQCLLLRTYTRTFENNSCLPLILRSSHNRFLLDAKNFVSGKHSIAISRMYEFTLFRFRTGN